MELSKKTSEIRVLYDQGIGVYHAMNHAIYNSSPNDWIWFLNAGDEFAATNSYEKVFETILITNSQWVYGGHYLGSAEGILLGEIRAPRSFKPSNQLFARKYISHQSAIFKSKFIQDLGGFDVTYYIASDWDLMVRASKIDTGDKIDIPVSTFYMGGISTAARNVGNYELLKIRNKHLSKMYLIKSYSWFLYRSVRNRVVLCAEKRCPQTLDKVRKKRFKLKRILGSK